MYNYDAVSFMFLRKENNMPTDTFFGLSDEKKEKIIEAGKKEFASTTFDLTSIKNISEDARNI